MRILQVVHDFVPETLAGAEVNTHKLSTDLQLRYGHEVHVFCRGWNLQCEPYRERDELLDGLHVRRVDFGRDGTINRWRRHDARVDAALRAMIEQVRPELIHVQHFIYLTTDIVAVAKEYGAPVVVSLRNFWFRCPLGTLLYHDDSLCQRRPGSDCLSCLWPDPLGRRRRLIPWRQLNPLLIGLRERMGASAPLPAQTADILSSLVTWEAEFRTALLQADRLHSPSQFLKRQLIDFGVPAERVAVVRNGAHYDPARVQEKRRGRRLRFGMIGMHRAKGLHVLVEAFRQLPRDVAELRVYGQVADQRYAAEQRQRAAGCNIEFRGTYDQRDLYSIFSEIDVLVVPSIWFENCPTVIPEAFATGTPVIAAAIGGMAEAVRDGVDGLLFAPSDAASLRACLERLIANPDTVQALARNITQPLTVEQCTDGIVDLYRQVTSTLHSGAMADDAHAQLGDTCQVSAIVPVYNEERHLAACLQSLLDQVRCTLEILVVDDGSTDQSLAIMRRFAARDARVRVLRQPHRGAGAARNLAAQAARGAVLAFCDGDMVFQPEYLATLIAPIERGEAVGTFSKEEYVANWDNVWARCWNLNDGITTNRRHPEGWPDRHEVFRAVRRDLFLRAQGFESAGSGDDRSLATRIDALAQAVPGAVCYHYNPDTLAEAFRSARWYGRGRRIPATWRNILLHTPPVSLKRSVKRAMRHRLPSFLLLKAVVDVGILTGLIEKRLRIAGSGR